MLDSNLRKNYASLSGLSISGLTVLCAIVEEGSVTRAAKKLNLSQPAASQTLKQLRGTFKDPLVKRRHGQLIPTERALAIHEVARRVLADIANLTLSPENFDPSVLTDSFVIGVQNSIAPNLIQNAISEISRLAPHARVTVQHLEAGFDITRALSTNMMDVVLGDWAVSSPLLRSMLVMEDDMVCLLDAKHPLAGQDLSLGSYREARHLIVCDQKPFGREPGYGELGSGPALSGRNVITDNHLYAPFMLQDSDLVLTVARRFARCFAEILPLAMIECPVKMPPLRIFQIWHHRSDHALGQRWLRNVIARVD
ncbi:LysR family transcriptional regulator [Rhizobium sp. CSW-27]|uniref:LysR family transcriptional regulator n=1 Tax=Rhizobium sp. CSW-27 TaxID=2839985 RepID=UPI001C01804C|nr:LysR family transcriptional regulator [Rhizobium sp. CSW-27]MBT9370380.1 LysR family transcriptional regulator [Rhizobium sp. CSW-27]